MWSRRQQHPKEAVAEPSLTYERAVAIALSMETADKDAQDLKGVSEVKQMVRDKRQETRTKPV